MTESAIGSSDDILPPNDARIAKQAIGHKLRMFDNVRGMTDDARHQHFPRRQFDVLPNAPFMFVPDIARLKRITLRIDAQDMSDDIGKWNVMGMCAMP